MRQGATQRMMVSRSNTLETKMAAAPTPLKTTKPLTRPVDAVNDAPAPQAAPKRLREGAIQILEHHNAVWAAVAPADHALADVVRPEFVGLRFERMRPFD